MAISGVSPSVANPHPVPAAGRPPLTRAQQTGKTAPPPAVKPAADTDGDRDGSGGINVKA